MSPDDAPATSIACDELLALRRGVSSASLPGGGLHLVAWPYAEPIGRLTSGQQAVLRALAVRAHTHQELSALAGQRRRDDGVAAPPEAVPGSSGAGDDGDAGPDAVADLLARLRAGGWLEITVSCRGRALYTMSPLRPPPPPSSPPPSPPPSSPPPPPSPPPSPSPPREAEAALVLSRFAVLRQDDDGLVLESPRAWCDIRVHDPAVLTGALGRLAGPQAVAAADRVAGSRDGDDGDAGGRRLVGDLCWAGLAVPAGSEDGELRLRQWSPHELWFHERSRITSRGFLGEGYGATYWAKGRFDPLPARPEPFPGPAVELHRPDLEALRRTDPPMAAVLEDRRSVREQDDGNPITGEQLGEFLYRCARTRGEPVTLDGEEITFRVYPAGGGACELEVYPVVRHAAGLTPGMYHYDSSAHQLRLVREVSHPAVRHLLRASVPYGEGPSQVLLVLSARVGRVMWKYEAMAYALMLKHVGVLHQTMYLVATAMGLAPCAIGTGDATAFTQATGRDPMEECSVGEFALGSLPPGGLPPMGLPSRRRPPRMTI
jgi:SagB-type dehydrogenase family enzyme